MVVECTREPTPGRDDLSVRVALGAQLHDVDAAAQHALQVVDPDHVADEVQTGVFQTLAAISHACECGRTRAARILATGAPPSA